MADLEDLYELGDELGRGGFGVVLAGTRRSDRRRVVVKLPLIELSEEVRARAAREARLAERVRHPHLVEFLGLHEDEQGRPALVYERIDGRELETTLGPEPPGAAQVAGWIGEVAGALDALHSAGLVHRDVKPANVLLGDDGCCRLIDLGLMRPDESGETLTQVGMVLGTPAYMAPEIFRLGVSEAPADQYSLACLAYRLLAGSPPFRGDPPELMQAHLSASPPRIRDLRPDLAAGMDAVFRRALGKDPDGRFPSCSAFAEALAAAARLPADSRAEDTILVSSLAPDPLAETRPRGSGFPLGVGPPLVVALLLVGLGLGLRGEAGPREVKWAVRGPSLAVSFDPGDASGFRLELGGRVVEAEPRRVGGRTRLVHQGLEVGVTVPARLLWDGGAGEAQPIEGERPAVRDPRPGPEGRLRLECARRCTVWWESIPDSRTTLDPGEVTLSVPPPPVGGLRGEEDGVPFRVEVTALEVHDRLVRDLEAILNEGDVDHLVEARRRSVRAGREADLEPMRRRVAELQPWISRALAGPLGVAARRRLWSRWQQVERCRAQDRHLWFLRRRKEGGAGFARGPPAPLALPGAGARRLGGESPGGVRTDLDHLPLLSTPREYWPLLAKPRPSTRTRVRFPWPPAPGDGALVEVSLEVDDLPIWGELRLRGEDGLGAPFELAFWYESIDPEDDDHSGWLRVVLPRDLLPRPGTEVTASFPTLVGPEADYMELESLRLRAL